MVLTGMEAKRGWREGVSSRLMSPWTGQVLDMLSSDFVVHSTTAGVAFEKGASKNYRMPPPSPEGR